MVLLKSCACGSLIDYKNKSCEACKQAKTAKTKEYDETKRRNPENKIYNDFYKGAPWTRVRRDVLNRHGGLDLYAYYIDKEIVDANTVHHIEELKDNWSRRLDPRNLVPLSLENHSKIHKLYEGNKKETQKLLFSLLMKWEKEQGGGGYKKV